MRGPESPLPALLLPARLDRQGSCVVVLPHDPYHVVARDVVLLGELRLAGDQCAGIPEARGWDERGAEDRDSVVGVGEDLTGEVASSGTRRAKATGDGHPVASRDRGILVDGSASTQGLVGETLGQQSACERVVVGGVRHGLRILPGEAVRQYPTRQVD